MSIANDKIVNLQDAKVLYDDLRGRIKDNRVVETLDTPADIQSFSDAARFPMELKVGIDPVQDLHGYDHPWAGGAGKNLLQRTMGSEGGSGIQYTYNDDGSIVATGTATANISNNIGIFTAKAGETYILTGTPTSVSNNSIYVRFHGPGENDFTINLPAHKGNNFERELHFDTDTTGYVAVRIGSGETVNGLVFKPMIRLATETDATFAPYENVCPITGWTGAKVTATGKNLLGGNALIAEMQKNEFEYELVEGGFIFTGSKVAGVPFISDNYFKENTQYTLFLNFKRSSTSGLGNLRIVYTDGTYYRIPNPGITPIQDRYVTDSEKTVLRIQGEFSSGTTTVYFDGTGLFEGDVSAEDFEEYKGETCNVTFPTSTGTVYGGELTIHSDGSGELNVNRGRIEATWGQFISKSTLGANVRGLYDLPLPCVYPQNTNNPQISNIAPMIANYNLDSMHFYCNKSQARMFLPIDTPETTEIKIIYELATPLTYSLTTGQVFALLGFNKVWADCGQINYIEYVRDTVGKVIPNRFDGIDQDIVETNTYEKTISEANAIQSFDDGAEWPIGMQITVDSVQDLHGYNNPWPSGGGKNLINKDDSAIKAQLYIDPTTGVSKTSSSLSEPYRSVVIPCKASTSYIASNAIITTIRMASFVNVPSNNEIPTVFNVPSGTTPIGTGVTITTGASDTYLMIQMLANDDVTGGVTSDLALAKLMVEEGSTVHTWEPYSNVCPITGWTGTNVTVAGKNLFGGETLKNTFVTKASATVDETNKTVSFYGRYYQTTDFCSNVQFKENTQYTFVLYGRNLSESGSTRANLVIRYTDGSYDSLIFNENGPNTNSYCLCTSDTGKTISGMTGYYSTSTETVLYYDQCGVFEGVKTLNDFVPYTGTVYPITFPASAGTVYGGTLSVNKDGTGTLVVKEEKVSFGSDQNWTLISSRNGFRLSSVLPSHESGYPTKCEWLKTKTTVSTETGVVLGVDNSHLYVDGVINVIPGVTNVESWKTYLDSNPLVLTKPIAPVTYSLTAPQVLSLLGQRNHVWADCGDILSLTYNSKQGIEFIREDTAGQINAVVNPVKTELADAEAAMAIVVDGDTAPKNITSGQYMFVKNHSTLATGLYHATEAISSGASIAGKVEADADGGFNALNSNMESIFKVFSNDMRDWDNMKSNGYHFTYVSPSFSSVSPPWNDYDGWLFTIICKSGSYVFQLAFKVPTKEFKHRVYNNGSWGAWG